MSFDSFSNCTRSADYTKPTATASRVWQVEVELEQVWAHRTAEEVPIHLNQMARTLAAQVDARDEVITKLLDLTAPHIDEFGNRQWWQYKRPEQMHARACEIAGRTE